MPPPGIGKEKKLFDATHICVPVDGSDCLCIEFDDPGYLLPLQYNTGDFSPDLPAGLFQKGTIGPYRGMVNNATVVLGYFDVSNLSFYVYTVKIQQACAATTMSPCPCFLIKKPKSKKAAHKLRR